MRAATLYELRIEWAKPSHGLFDVTQVDSINRYARDDKHAETIGRKFAREVLKATGLVIVKTRILKL